MPPSETLSYAAAEAPATRLNALALEKAAAANVLLSEAEQADRASKLIRAMLRQVHSSDVFSLKDE